jgi:hypothetical protein
MFWRALIDNHLSRGRLEFLKCSRQLYLAPSEESPDSQELGVIRFVFTLNKYPKRQP